MSLRTGAAARVCAGGLAGLVGLSACSKHAAPVEQRGPVLSLYVREGTPAARSIVTPAAVALALGGLPPEELRRLRKHMAESTDGALRRAAPGLFDLDAPPDAGAAVDPLQQSLPDLPALTAAANVVGTPWEAPGISVHLGAGCEPGATRCVPLFGTASGEGDSMLRRGRALTWALADAGLLRASAAGRAQLLHSLREAQLRSAGVAAMVFAASSGNIDPSELDPLRHEARRSLETLRPDAPQRPWLEALDQAPASWELPVALDPDELLVVPRLSALARLPDFVSEVEAAGTFEWAARPGGLLTDRR
jgi:hypothetical protein